MSLQKVAKRLLIYKAVFKDVCNYEKMSLKNYKIVIFQSSIYEKAHAKIFHRQKSFFGLVQYIYNLLQFLWEIIMVPNCEKSPF